MYCNACGKAISDDARFCAHCGTVLGQMPVPKKLMRPRTGRTIAGICAGLGHYLELDVTLVRLMFALVTLVSGIFPGVVVYLLAWIIVPEEPFALPAAPAGQPITSQ